MTGTIEFHFEDGSVKAFVIQGTRLDFAPVLNGVKLLRGLGFDPQECTKCILYGKDAMKDLRRGLDGEGEEHGWAEPFTKNFSEHFFVEV